MDSMPQEMRQSLCDKTKATCNSSCSSNVKEVACNVDTLRWSCKCNDDKIKLATYGFPIPLNMCLLDRQNCTRNCEHLGKTNHMNEVCEQQCAFSFPCGTEKAATDENNGAANLFNTSAIAKRPVVPVSGADAKSSSMYALHAALAGAVLLFGSGITVQ